MTNRTRTTDVQALSQAVAGLNEALARSEKRYSHLARIVCWSTLGIVSLLAFVLMQRIRQDSDAFRAAVLGPEVALEGIGKELNLMNAALSAVPVMATQMDLMNRNISSMSYSMGTTMGRMGKWMPW